MGKNIIITEAQFKRIIMLEHQSVINNVGDVEKLIEMQWENPDDYWFVQFTQRRKDFKKYNIRHGGSSKWWTRTPGADGTGRENFAGYAVISGDTLENTLYNLRHMTVKLNPWASKIIGNNVLTSPQGSMEAMYKVCDTLFARAYITINKRSRSAVSQLVNNDIQNGQGLRSFVRHSAMPKSGNDGTNDWDKLRPWTMADCDIDDPQIQKDIEDYIEQNNFQSNISHLSHDGKHYFFNTPDVSKVDLSQFLNAKTTNRPGDPAIEFKRDAKMMIYSPCGQ